MPLKKQKVELIVDPNRFIPVKGRRASVIIEDVYYDCIIQNFMRRGREARVMREVDEELFDIDVSELEKPLESDVNERFDYFRDLTQLVMHGKLKSLFVSGEGGIGKSFTLAELLASEQFIELGDGKIAYDPVKEIDVEQYDYARVKGYTTARAMFDYIKEHNTKLIIFEDCDSALTDPTAQNILKAVLDTYERRRVSWMTAKGTETFDFHGSIVFLSNKNKADVNQAIISRSVIIDLFMTRDEIVERMEFLLPGLDCAPLLTIEEKFDVLRIIDKYKHTIGDLNLRTLIKALVVYENKKDMNLTRYQVLNG